MNGPFVMVHVGKLEGFIRMGVDSARRHEDVLVERDNVGKNGPSENNSCRTDRLINKVWYVGFRWVNLDR